MPKKSNNVKNKKKVAKSKMAIKPRTNVTSITSNPFFNARLCWTFALNSDTAETSFGLKISDIFLYLREQFEIDETMKLFFKLKSGKFMDYGYRIHTCKMFNLPTLKDGHLGESAVKEFFPRTFSSPNGFSLKWNKTTKNHTFEEPTAEGGDDYLCIIRVGKPISDTVKSTTAYMVVNIGWRTINEDPIRESPSGITELVSLSAKKSALKVPKFIDRRQRHQLKINNFDPTETTYMKPATLLLLQKDLLPSTTEEQNYPFNALSHAGTEVPRANTVSEPVSTSLLSNPENLSELLEGVDSLVLNE